MTINRFEIPNLIKFGNLKNIEVFFHTVVKPIELSLKFQSKELLNELLVYLFNFNFRSKTITEKTNNRNYQNLILLIESWKNEFDTLVKVEKSTTNIVYEKLLIENDREIINKTEFLIQYFEDKQLIDSVTNALNILDADFLYNNIKKLSLSELICFVEHELEKNNILRESTLNSY
jgi:hypothetical protein